MYMNANLAVPAANRPPRRPAEDALAASVRRPLALARTRPRACSPSSSPDGSTSPSIAAMLIALKIKGETADELIGAARALRAADAPFERPDYLFADSCGTGGDGSGTINLSTAVAFVAAAAGLPVAKHGNRSVTSRCGSADVLEQLGVKLDVVRRGLAPRARRDRPLLPVRARLSSRPASMPGRCAARSRSARS